MNLDKLQFKRVGLLSNLDTIYIPGNYIAFKKYDKIIRIVKVLDDGKSVVLLTGGNPLMCHKYHILTQDKYYIMKSVDEINYCKLLEIK